MITGYQKRIYHGTNRYVKLANLEIMKFLVHAGVTPKPFGFCSSCVSKIVTTFKGPQLLILEDSHACEQYNTKHNDLET